MTEQRDFAAEPIFTLGWRIKRALDFGGLDNNDLAAKFEVSRGTVSRWCRDIAPAPKKFVLNEIAVMCGVSARWLINGPQLHGPDDGGTTALPPVAGKSSCSNSRVVRIFPVVKDEPATGTRFNVA